MRAWWNRVRAVLGGRPAIDREVADEVASHLEMEIERLVEGGMPLAAARAAALSRFGNATRVAENAHDSWGFPVLEGLAKDIRLGFRAMRRAPGFAAVVILTFALGVGVNAAIFSVVHAVLLRPLPYPDSERLVRLGEANAKGGFSVSWGNFNYWRSGNHTFEDMAAMQFTDRTLTGRGDPVSVRGITVTAPYYALLGMQPLRGRLLDASDDKPGAHPVIVLSQQFWLSQFGGDPAIVGATVILNGNPFEVAGVAAPVWTPWKADYYLSLGRILGVPTSRGQHGSIRALARLKPGISLARGRADLDAIMRHLGETDPGPEADHHSSGALLSEETIGDVRTMLWVLMGAAALILLIACANIASLLLARNTARAGELALRRAIGAGQFRVVRQLFTENAVLALTGGAAGILLAQSCLRILLGLAPRNIPRLAQTTIDVSVLLFACGITLAAGILAGLAPVLAAGSVDLAGPLKEGVRVMGGKRRQSFRNGLVVAEIAVTFVLAFGSGLLLRSLAAAQQVNPGFDPHNVLMFSLSLPGKTYQNDAAMAQFYSRLTADLRGLPGVTGAAAVHCPPSAGDCGDWFYSVPGRPEPSRDQVPVSLFNTAEPGYFHLMRIPLIAGREFTDMDRDKGAKVAVVNEKLARRWWPNESPVGRQIKVGGPYQEGDLLEVIGVAGDVRQYGLDTSSEEEIYRPSSQILSSDMEIMVRTAGDPARLMPAVRGRVLALNRNLPLQQFGTLEEALGAGLARRRFSTTLLTMFAGLAMLLAAVGIYGLLSYWVASREPEIAVRLALGASPSRILRWTGLNVFRLAIVGVGFGAIGGWYASRLLEEMVFRVPVRNPAAFAAAALAVLALALMAAAVPAWRAASVDAAHRLHHG